MCDSQVSSLFVTEFAFPAAVQVDMYYAYDAVYLYAHAFDFVLRNGMNLTGENVISAVRSRFSSQDLTSLANCAGGVQCVIRRHHWACCARR